jgi:hypothetical protein
MNKTNEKEKLKWISVLDTFPFFVVIYDKVKEKITYFNNHISNTIFPTKFLKSNLHKLLTHRQEMKILEKDHIQMSHLDIRMS